MAGEQLANRIPKEVYTGNDRRKMETDIDKSMKTFVITSAK
jgi:hypothetical protein